ncbi:PAQR family membrane homeostasis protein TrhA [Marinomonas primoryensis]|jgi:hemolysin III|uniref:Hemolysin III family protein n=1 Tax=Marinomonas primoryensis TaxID=178399 RepID=A0A859CTN9_9GAMM|nr:hemolysin III family protein [Marinomonas primoryensis]QKK79683.1 hemolysin III family protein [Marinomonas primoryensis]|tara:strand:+ start:200 stop:859 length:660 start_codon:yes stop_codon:yes gene_type:complete
MGKYFSAASNRGQSLGEEVANSISHGLGLVAAIVGTPFLILSAIDYADMSFLVGVSIFSATMIVLYLASTVYHAMPQGKAKYVFQVIDHSAVYLLIAGTYTPFMLGVLEGVWGWSLLVAVWTLAMVGVGLKAFGKASHPAVSTTLYVILGWLILIAIKPLVALMEPDGLLLLVLGGVLYTLGVVFFVIDSRLRYGHLVWHLFVVGGTVSHYFSIFYYGA